MQPRRSLLAVVAALCIAALLTACGEREPRNHPAAPPNAAGEGDGESWWLLDAPGFAPVSGGATPEEISNTTGSLWLLEYSNGPQNLRLVADRAGGLFSQLSQASPELGTTTIDGDIEVTLRQHPGRPEEGIAPSVGAEWTDNEVFISFGGPGLTEPEVRDHLTRLRRVTREEWQAAAGALPPPAEDPATPSSPLASVVP